jgi:hypothetical protein
MMNKNQKKLYMLLSLLVLIPALAWGQTKTITGVVKDNLGEVVIGASVVEVGTTNVTAKPHRPIICQKQTRLTYLRSHRPTDVWFLGKNNLSSLPCSD